MYGKPFLKYFGLILLVFSLSPIGNTLFILTIDLPGIEKDNILIESLISDGIKVPEKYENMLDLNKSNILFNNHKICFIDYDYVSINNRFSDLARIFSSYKFTEKDINIFLEIYGLDNSKNNFHTIKNWQLMNLYTDSIWFYFLMENGLNKQNQNYLFLTEELIKQQMQ